MNLPHHAHHWRTTTASLTLAMLILLPGPAPAQAAPTAPLPPSEFEAVIAEIKRMVATPEYEADRFVVREATPARIQRLYAMPELLAQPRNIRENGLIFAGKGALLSFGKPSDIIAKVARWFPEEVQRARADSTFRFHGKLHLYGPFPSWEDEPAAFMGLWNCMPQSLWMQPELDPFRLRSGTSNLAHFPITARSSDHAQADFGRCIRQRNAKRTNWKDGDEAAVEREMAETGTRIAEAIQRKFDALLQRQGCRGQGPDDCVQVLQLWTSLGPGDPRLARQTRRLEAEVLNDAPLPALAGPLQQPGWPGREGEPRFDALVRQAAFLRLKTASILAQPQAWPEDALPAALRQATRLQQRFLQEVGERQYMPDVSYTSAMLRPMRALDEHVAAPGPVRDAVLAELRLVAGEEQGCRLQRRWLEGLGQGLEASLVLDRRAQGLPEGCARPDWSWMKDGYTPEAVAMRTRFIDGLAQGGSSLERDAILSLLTDHGLGCFPPDGAKPAPWLAALCARWIHEPAQTPLALAHGRLVMDAGHAFQKTRFEAPHDASGRLIDADQLAWLAKVSQGLPPEAVAAVRALGQALQGQQQTIDTAELWRHPGHSRALLRLRLHDNEGTHRHLVLGPHTQQAFTVPERFDAGVSHPPLARVSDLDQDGQLELWFARDLDRCSGGEDDLGRAVDCSPGPRHAALMGEVSGDALSYFVNDASRRPVPGPGERWRSLPRATGPVPPPDHGKAPCNRVLLGQVLGEPLGLAFGEDQGGDEQGQVITMACKQHPLDARLTIVALFHGLGEAPDATGESRQGFVMAVVDVLRAKVLRVYRDTIEEDATIRVHSGGLRLDTAPYQLAPGVRALGVRMLISHSPRYAEGGEGDYLTLVVEEGRRLRPVLVRRAMSHWRLTDTSCWNDPEGECVMEESTTHLELGTSSSEGWRDLELVETTSVQGAEGTQVSRRKAGTLRAKGGRYD